MMSSGRPLPSSVRELWLWRVLRLQQRQPSLREMHHLSSRLLPGGPVLSACRQDLPGELCWQNDVYLKINSSSLFIDPNLSCFPPRQDRDECLEITDLCGDQQKCLNTPGNISYWSPVPIFRSSFYLSHTSLELSSMINYPGKKLSRSSKSTDI